MNINPVSSADAMVAKSKESADSKTSQATDSAARGTGKPPEHIPSAELTRLLDLVTESPDVRAERVDEAARLLASGYFLTPDAADATAQAILNDPERL